MIGNYFKVLSRSLWRNKFFSLLNFLGLAIGMTCYLLIFQYSTFEFSYDDLHRNKDRIYRLRINFYENNAIKHKHAQSPFSVAPVLKTDYPEVEEVVRCRVFRDNTVRCKEQIFREEKIYFAETSLFKIFSFQLVNGNPENVLDGPNKILLSESAARKYFGAEDPMGKAIEVSSRGKTYSCMVNGIFKDVPENSHLKFDVLISMDTLLPPTATDWVFTNFYTYILLKPGADPKALEAKFPDFIQKYIVKHAPLTKNWEFLLQPLKEIYLYSNLTHDTDNGNGVMVYFLLIVAFLVLVISWVNYVNLSTARAMERAREVGIRKVLGSFRGQLIKQFLAESVLVNIIPIIIAVILGIILTPYLRALTGKNIPLYIAGDIGFWVHLLVLYIAGSLLSGLYPAFVLSSFKPVTVLKRSKLSHTTGGILLRKFLVGFQFVAAVILIVVTFAVYHQIQYMRNKDLGINIDHMIGITLPSIPVNQEYFNNVTSLKTELLRYPAIKYAAGSSFIPGTPPRIRRMIWKEGDDFMAGQIQSIIFLDEDYLPAYQVKFLAGRNFSKEFGTDQYAAVLNEAAIKLLGLDKAADALDKNITIYQTPGKFKVIGVIQNYHHQSLKESYDPIVFLYNPYYKSYYSLKLDPSANIPDTLKTIREKWDKAFPGYPLDYFFLDDFFNRQYKSDLKFGNVLGIFVILTVIITCLGLLSLSYFNSLQRTREIGVRKSFGAGFRDILLLLTGDIVKLIGIAAVIAWPIAFILISNWLKNYADRIPMPWLFFILSGLLVAAVSLATVSYHTVRAARANPADALREE
jgi:putative ABC transport system permease protein